MADHTEQPPSKPTTDQQLATKPIITRLTRQEAETGLVKVPPVHYSNLMTTAAMSSLGLIASALLLQHEQVTLMVGTDGNIEVVPVGELELDLLDEASALQELVNRDYSDQQMAEYLRQREVRLSRAANPR
jgi:hypothetical protein